MFLLLMGYIGLSAGCIALGLLFETLPQFWRGLLCGLGAGLCIPLLLASPGRQIDISTLPEPSANVKQICDDPNRPLVEAVKAYREETGRSLSEATAILKTYMANQQSGN